MYREIGARVVRGAPGDELRSVEGTSRLMLTLEAELLAARSRTPSVPRPTETLELRRARA